MITGRGITLEEKALIHPLIPILTMNQMSQHSAMLTILTIAVTVHRRTERAITLATTVIPMLLQVVNEVIERLI